MTTLRVLVYPALRLAGRPETFELTHDRASAREWERLRQEHGQDRLMEVYYTVRPDVVSVEAMQDQDAPAAYTAPQLFTKAEQRIASLREAVHQ